ncbi:MAG: hypothetical protein QOD12_2547 [Verrucomicrobiota bacterium]|jgi:hypothetical protein
MKNVTSLMMIETSPPDLPVITPRFDRIQNETDAAASVRALAKGVLRQAAKDLRAFHDAPEATGRELYRDAYSWVTSNDLSWPYSFVNVCEALGLSAEFVRLELVADARSGWYSHSRLVARRISTSVRGSLTKLFRRGDLAGTQKRTYAVEFPRLKATSPAGPIQLRNS